MLYAHPLAHFSPQVEPKDSQVIEKRAKGRLKVYKALLLSVAKVTHTATYHSWNDAAKERSRQQRMSNLGKNFSVRLPFLYSNTSSYHSFGWRGGARRKAPLSVLWLYLDSIKTHNPELFRASCEHYLASADKKLERAKANLSRSQASMATARAAGEEKKVQKYAKQVVQRTPIVTQRTQDRAAVARAVVRLCRGLPEPTATTAVVSTSAVAVAPSNRGT